MEKPFWHSKKFWFAVVGALIPPANFYLGLGLSVVEVSGVVGPLMAYIVGQGVADAGKNKN